MRIGGNAQQGFQCVSSSLVSPKRLRKQSVPLQNYRRMPAGTLDSGNFPKQQFSWSPPRNGADGKNAQGWEHGKLGKIREVFCEPVLSFCQNETDRPARVRGTKEKNSGPVSVLMLSPEGVGGVFTATNESGEADFRILEVIDDSGVGSVVLYSIPVQPGKVQQGFDFGLPFF